MYTETKSVNNFFLLAFILLSAVFAHAGPGRTTYQAKIVKPDGYPLESASVNFKFTILDPAGTCILYSETYSAVNMNSTGGLISFSLGSGVKTYPASATAFEDIFSNITSTLSCDAGGPPTYSPAAQDTRKIVMQFHDGSGWQTLPAMNINAVPYAMYANNADRLGGVSATSYLRPSTLPSCAASEAIRYNGSGFSCVAVGSAATPVTSGSVATALGYTPADGASVTALTLYAANVSSTVFSVSSTVSSLSTAFTSLSNSVAASFAAISGSGISTFNGSTSATQSFAIGTAGNAPAIVTAAGVHTLNIPYASVGTTTAGLISNSEYSLFSTVISKMTSSAASIAQVLGYTPANQTTVTVLSSTVSSVSSAANAAQNTANAVSSTVSVLSSNLLTSMTSVTSSVTLLSSTLTSFQSSTAASFATLTSSQWNTSGTSINYMAGHVGVGTASPLVDLQVDGEFVAGNTPTIQGNSSNSRFMIGHSNSYYNAGGGSNNAFMFGNSNSFDTGGSGSRNGFIFGRNNTVTNAASGDSFIIGHGIYSPVGNKIAMGLGSEQMTLLSTGNVGIGISAPTYLLHVSGSARVASLELGTVAVSGTNIARAGLIRMGGYDVIRLQHSMLYDGGDWANLFIGQGSGNTTNTGQFNYGVGNGTLTNLTTGIGNAAFGTDALGDVTSGQHNTAMGRDALGQSTTGSYNVGVGYRAGMYTSSNASAPGMIRSVAIGPDAKFLMGSSTNEIVIGYNASGGGSNTVMLGSNAITKTYLNGQVGINVSATAKLHIDAGTTSVAPLKFTSGVLTSSAQSGTIEYDGFKFWATDSANTRRQLVVSSSAVIAEILGFMPTSGSSSQWNTSGTTINYVNGNVGIGTSSPQAELHTYQSSLTEPGVLLEAPGAISPSIYWYRSMTTANAKYWRARTNSNTDWFLETVDDTMSNPNVAIQVVRAANSVTGVYFPSSNVGVGTSSAAYALTVSGTVHSTYGGYRFPDNTTQTTAFVSSAAAVSQMLGYTPAASGAWMTQGTNVYYTAGNVGVGINNPSVPLDVSGTARLKGNETGGSRFYLTNSSTGGRNWVINSTGSASTGGAGKVHIADYSLGWDNFAFDQYSRFGVGTFSPQAPIHIVSATPYTQYEDSSNSQSFMTGTDQTRYFVRQGSVANTDLFTVTSGGNVGIGVSNTLAGLHIFRNSSPASYVTMAVAGGYQYSWTSTGADMNFRDDTNGNQILNINPFTAGGRSFNIMNSKLGLGTTAPSYTLGLYGNPTIGVERTPSGAGQQLIIRSGGASQTATDANGGALVFMSGISTGTGSAAINFQTSSGTAAGTADANPVTRVQITGGGDLRLTTTGAVVRFPDGTGQSTAYIKPQIILGISSTINVTSATTGVLSTTSWTAPATGNVMLTFNKKPPYVFSGCAGGNMGFSVRVNGGQGSLTNQSFITNIQRFAGAAGDIHYEPAIDIYAVTAGTTYSITTEYMTQSFSSCSVNLNGNSSGRDHVKIEYVQ